MGGKKNPKPKNHQKNQRKKWRGAANVLDTIRRKVKKADILVGACYNPLNQDEETNGIFSEGLGEAPQSLALLLSVCWKYNTEEAAAVSLRHTQVSRTGWDPLEGAEQAAERAHTATSKHLPAVLAI